MKEIKLELEKRGFSVSQFENELWITDMNAFKEEGIYFNFKLKIPSKKKLSIDEVIRRYNENKGYDSFYKSFSLYFEKIMEGEGLKFGCYATNYGIGVFAAFGGRFMKNDKERIDSILEKKGIEYTNEYSDAGWVFRYKISKSKENIQKISG